MELTFKKAANGQDTCCVNNLHLHSSYNPAREAQKFSNQIEKKFNAKYLIITEPALSYCAEYLRTKFPETKLCCIRYCHDFDKTNFLWDKVFYSESQNLQEELFSYLGDEGIATCNFASWTPSQTPFNDEYIKTWDAIKSAVLKSRNVLATRNYFSQRWVKNALRLSLNTENNYTIKRGNFPVLICASGRSLYSSLDKIKQYRNNFFLIAVSSAMRPLVSNGITPDLCISTDGGYWAKKHLTFALKNKDIPLALASESSCFADIIKNTKIIPLSYQDSPADDILKFSGVNYLKAQRNGTVSGTASILALGITTAPVFFCGLDLSSNNSFQHTQPNELEIQNSIFDNKFCNTETRVYPSTLFSPTLEIYKNWFASTDFNSQLFRLSNNYLFSNSLGTVKDINWDYFISLTEKYRNKTCDIKIEKLSFNNETTPDKVLNFINQNINSKKWEKDFAPLQYIAWEKSCGFPEEEECTKNLKTEMSKNYSDIKRCLSGGTL